MQRHLGQQPEKYRYGRCGSNAPEFYLSQHQGGAEGQPEIEGQYVQVHGLIQHDDTEQGRFRGMLLKQGGDVAPVFTRPGNEEEGAEEHDAGPGIVEIDESYPFPGPVVREKPLPGPGVHPIEHSHGQAREKNKSLGRGDIAQGLIGHRAKQAAADVVDGHDYQHQATEKVYLSITGHG